MATDSGTTMRMERPFIMTSRARRFITRGSKKDRTRTMLKTMALVKPTPKISLRTRHELVADFLRQLLSLDYQLISNRLLISIRAGRVANLT